MPVPTGLSKATPIIQSGWISGKIPIHLTDPYSTPASDNQTMRSLILRSGGFLRPPAKASCNDRGLTSPASLFLVTNLLTFDITVKHPNPISNLQSRQQHTLEGSSGRYEITERGDLLTFGSRISTASCFLLLFLLRGIQEFAVWDGLEFGG